MSQECLKTNKFVVHFLPHVAVDKDPVDIMELVIKTPGSAILTSFIDESDGAIIHAPIHDLWNHHSPFKSEWIKGIGRNGFFGLLSYPANGIPCEIASFSIDLLGSRPPKNKKKPYDVKVPNYMFLRSLITVSPRHSGGCQNVSGQTSPASAGNSGAYVPAQP